MSSANLPTNTPTPTLSPTDAIPQPGPLRAQQAQHMQSAGGASSADASTLHADRDTVGENHRPVVPDRHRREQSSSKRMDAPRGGMLPQTQSIVNAMNPNLRPTPIPLSATRQPYPASAIASSPARLRSSSPRLPGPASSEIFERNVQEPVPISTLEGEMSPAHIPSHMITEDHIPPALEASVEAITSEDLNVDEVEIVTSASHQSAAASVLESSTSHADLTQLHAPPKLHHERSDGSESAFSMHNHSGIVPTVAEDDGASNYGQLDPNDVRRVSFISFADVARAEHQQQQQQQQIASLYAADVGSKDSFPGLSNVPAPDRDGSPLKKTRSPASIYSQSPTRAPVTTPPGEQSSGANANAGSQHGELTIETMRQAVRKTASGDLSGARSTTAGLGISPISDDQSTRGGADGRSRTKT